MKKNNHFSYGILGKTQNNEGLFRKNMLKSLFSSVSDKRIAFMMQVHSDHIEIVDERDEYDNTDALITDRKDVILTGTFADCAPIYFYVNNTSIMALAHSGWRGSKRNISLKVIHKIMELYDVKSDDIYVEIGPCIDYKNYEVQEDFLCHFDRKYFIFDNDKIYFDLKAYNYDIISGVIPNDNICVDSRCTFEDLNLHSYRRDREKSGRNIAYIYSK